MGEYEKLEKIDWDIGTYGGRSGVCVNGTYKGVRYHRHDYFGIVPRWMRIGWYMRSIEKQSGYGNDYIKWSKVCWVYNS